MSLKQLSPVGYSDPFSGKAEIPHPHCEAPNESLLQGSWGLTILSSEMLIPGEKWLHARLLFMQGKPSW